MTKEKILMNEIKLYASSKGWIVIRNNVGTFKLADGAFLNTGLPKGWPDLTILSPNGQTAFIETKIKPNKPSKEQINIINLLNSYNFPAFVIYSLEDFIQKMSNFY